MHITNSFYNEKEALIKDNKKDDILLELDKLAEKMSFEEETISDDVLTIKYACYEITYLRARLKELVRQIEEDSV